jgi:hypothetical protein
VTEVVALNKQMDQLARHEEKTDEAGSSAGGPGRFHEDLGAGSRAVLSSLVRIGAGKAYGHGVAAE